MKCGIQRRVENPRVSDGQQTEENWSQVLFLIQKELFISSKVSFRVRQNAFTNRWWS